MKKIYILCITLIHFSGLFAQIPNASFEDIRNIIEYKPGYWESTGRLDQSADAHGGNYAMKVYGGNSQFGGGSFVYTASSPFNPSIPYEGKPTHLEFYMKGSFQPGDSLLLTANLTSAGQNYAALLTDITVVSANYTKITLPLNVIDTNLLSDTVAINLQFNGTDSSWFALDDMKFTINGLEEGQLLNGDFETWTTNAFRQIFGWSSTNDIGKAFGFNFNAVKDTNDAQQGGRCIYMQNISFFGSAIPGALVTGANNISQGPAFPVTGRHRFLNGYYKCKPAAGDTFTVMINMFYQGQEIGSGRFSANKTVSTWTKFSCDINYDSVSSASPDSASIMVCAGSLDNPVAGSKAWVDNLSFEATGLQDIQTAPLGFSIAPNPAAENIQILLSRISSESMQLYISDMQGKVVKNIYQGSALMVETSTSGLSSGTYIITLKDGQETVHRKLIVSHE